MTDLDLDQNDNDADMRRLTVRLPADIFERLREVAHQARRPPAELARLLLTDALMTGGPAVLPAPAPPAPAELGEAAAQILKVLQASLSNLAQLRAHALDLGEPLNRLAVEGGPLDRLQAQFRGLGIDIKKGLLAEAAADQLAELADAAGALNALAKRLNQHARQVAPAEWHPVIVALLKAAEKLH